MITVDALEPFLCGPLTSLREVMQRLGKSQHRFLLVADAAGRLQGIITDGDVRRAILQGSDLDQPVTTCMNKTPRVGSAKPDATESNLRELLSLESYEAFLPLLDERGVVKRLALLPRVVWRGTSALVMAGGQGKRLGELTSRTPKPLLHVGDKPILERVLTAIERAYIQDIWVSVHYLAEQIEEYLAQRKSIARIHVLREAGPLGTAGALSLLPADAPAPFLVLNGDVITRVDLANLLAFHSRQGLGATIAAARHEVKIPYGVIRHREDGTFDGVDEKPSVEHFVAAGIYVLEPEFRALVPDGQAVDMPALLNMGRNIGLKVGVFPIHEYWVDVGQPDDLGRARKRFEASDSQFPPPVSASTARNGEDES